MQSLYSAGRSRNLTNSLSHLRERAEKRLVQQSPIAPTVLEEPTEMQRLIQELRIHQIELEMQYEELLVTQAETESLRARYTDLFEFAPVGYVTLDVLGMVQELNQHGAKLLGTARYHLTNRRFLQFVAPPSRDAFLRLMIDVLAADEVLSLEVELLRDDDTPVRVRLDGMSLSDPGGTRLCRLAMTDVSAERRATAEL